MEDVVAGVRVAVESAEAIQRAENETKECLASKVAVGLWALK